MRNVICKIFAFLLELGNQVLQAVADTLVYVGTAAVDVLSDILSAASDGLLSSPLGIAFVTIGGFFLLKAFGIIGAGDDEETNKTRKEKGKGSELKAATSEGVVYV